MKRRLLLMILALICLAAIIPFGRRGSLTIHERGGAEYAFRGIGGMCEETATGKATYLFIAGRGSWLWSVPFYDAMREVYVALRIVPKGGGAVGDRGSTTDGGAYLYLGGGRMAWRVVAGDVQTQQSDDRCVVDAKLRVQRIEDPSNTTVVLHDTEGTLYITNAHLRVHRDVLGSILHSVVVGVDPWLQEWKNEIPR